MKLFAASVMATCCVAFVGGTVYSMPQGLTPEDLARRSDLIVQIKVISVTCDKQTKERDGKPRGSYRTQMRILQTLKGNAPAGAILEQRFHDPSDVLGDWSIHYFLGETAVIHLRWNKDQGTYEPVWWNAKEEVRKPLVHDLPSKEGETIALAEESPLTDSKKRCGRRR